MDSQESILIFLNKTSKKFIADINKHNKAFIADVNNKMGPDWKLVYSNKKKNFGFGVSFRKYAISIGHRNYFYEPINMPLLYLEDNPKLNREAFKERVDLVCKNTRSNIYHLFKEQYDKVYEVEKLAEDLNVSLQKKDEAEHSRKKYKI